jgi:hypothetical protein
VAGVNPVKPRLCYRANELPQLLGISKSTWHSYVARGVGPPSIVTPGEHCRLYSARSVERWIAESERAGRLLSTREFKERQEAGQ